VNISILLATRKRKHLLEKSINSLIQNANDATKVEFVFGIDEDDVETATFVNGVFKHLRKKIISFIKEQKKPTYKEEIFEVAATDKEKSEETEEYDERYDEALALVAKDRQASISYIQRRLRIGYNRAASIIEMMERDGVVGPSDGVRPREIYVNPIPVE